MNTKKNIMLAVVTCMALVTTGVYAGPQESAEAATQKLMGRNKGWTDKFFGKTDPESSGILPPDAVFNTWEALNAVYKSLVKEHGYKPGVALKHYVIEKASPDLLASVIEDNGIKLLSNIKGNGGCLMVHEHMKAGAYGATQPSVIHECAQIMKGIKATLSGEDRLLPGGCIKPSKHMMSLERYYNLTQQFIGENYKPKSAASQEAYYAGEDRNRPYIPPLGEVNYCDK